AVLALVVVGRQSDREPAGTAPASPPMVVARDDAAPPAPDANAPARARVAAKRAPEQRTQSAKVEPAPAREAEPAADDEAIAAVALGEADPPRELLERPDLFLDFPIVRKLDELQNLEAVLAESPGESGGAG
ncbi:MAG: hypothetical protein AB1689_10550, partial [Thermodesulfobacteriota bacterium]